MDFSHIPRGRSKVTGYIEHKRKWCSLLVERVGEEITVLCVGAGATKAAAKADLEAHRHAPTLEG